MFGYFANGDKFVLQEVNAARRIPHRCYDGLNAPFSNSQRSDGEWAMTKLNGCLSQMCFPEKGRHSVI